MTRKMIPGQIIAGEGEITLNNGCEVTFLTVANSGDRPVQVGSHYHFFEVNAGLVFDRTAAKGLRLDIPAGTAVRFEPGMERDVRLIPYGGERKAVGFQGKIMGALD